MKPHFEIIDGILIRSHTEDESLILPTGIHSIGIRAFEDCDHVHRIVVPDGVHTICVEAFAESGLTELILPSTLVRICDRAFFETELAYLYIPENVETIGKSALSGCTELRKIEVHPENRHFQSVDGSLYSKDGTILYFCGYGERKGSIWNVSTEVQFSVPETVEEITDSAFSGQRLGRLYIPANVTKISESAFVSGYAYTMIREIVVSPENPLYRSVDGALYTKDCSVLYYLPSIFNEDGKQQPVRLPSAVRRCCDDAIQCRFAPVILPEGMTEFHHEWCRRVQKDLLVFPSTMKQIDWLFPSELDSSLAHRAHDGSYSYNDDDEHHWIGPFMVMNDKIAMFSAEIGRERPLAGFDPDAETLVIPALAHSLDHISRLNYRKVILQEGFVNLLEGAFGACNNDVIEEVILPESLQKIYEYAFDDCFHLKRIAIPKNVCFISRNVFSGCENLTEITVDSENQHYQSIGGDLYTKDGKTLLFCASRAIGKHEKRDYHIADGTECIANDAFNCAEISTLYIPKTVNPIEPEGFSDNYAKISIDHVVVDADNPCFTVIHGALYSRDGSTLIFCPKCCVLAEYPLPQTLRLVRDNAIRNPYDEVHRNLVFLDGFTSFSDTALMNLTAETLTFPRSLQTLQISEGRIRKICGYRGSYAETAAEMYGIPFEAMD